ncbi:PIN domain-containing protein [Microbulbifer spongiae]|uniref:PIN domain-containing protein n=1 Tax=Microbulbifer spongiae TaxID=2944933 RepID=A0ABY9E5S0_9GAMM|nr:PIN domain-containing protein [Microbulbifer sp. MI-G]WKD48358.1 PIN domain-containing protein [Microbulbifer sp. MI-G]
MSTIVKEKIAPRAVIVDTNILFDQDKSNVVHPDFDKFWSEHAIEANLKLMLPEVVIGEVLFQQTTSALKTLSRVNDSFGRLSKYTGKSYSHRVTESRLRREIKKRFLSWANSKNYKEISTPINEIDWSNIVHSSIWRIPPFSYDPKKESLEKGFRDALILETVVSYCENDLENKIVFITNDGLLREASEKRLQEDETFIAFESLVDFEANLRLEKESLEQTFIKSVVKKAAKKFFKSGDKNSLVYKLDLSGQIKNKFANKFKNPQTLMSEDSEADFDSDYDWKSVSPRYFGIDGNPQFQKIENDHTFIWLSKIRVHQEYECESGWDNEKYEFTHEIFFNIFWQSNISVNQRFTKMKLISIKHVESKFTRKNE